MDLLSFSSVTKIYKRFSRSRLFASFFSPHLPSTATVRNRKIYCIHLCMYEHYTRDGKTLTFVSGLLLGYTKYIRITSHPRAFTLFNKLLKVACLHRGKKLTRESFSFVFIFYSKWSSFSNGGGRFIFLTRNSH